MKKWYTEAQVAPPSPCRPKGAGEVLICGEHLPVAAGLDRAHGYRKVLSRDGPEVVRLHLWCDRRCEPDGDSRLRCALEGKGGRTPFTSIQPARPNHIELHGMRASAHARGREGGSSHKDRTGAGNGTGMLTTLESRPFGPTSMSAIQSTAHSPTPLLSVLEATPAGVPSRPPWLQEGMAGSGEGGSHS